jgi:hypothetical protein
VPFRPDSRNFFSAPNPVLIALAKRAMTMEKTLRNPGFGAEMKQK